eukprot:6460591-Amphidinium_carterae.1
MQLIIHVWGQGDVRERPIDRRVVQERSSQAAELVLGLWIPHELAVEGRDACRLSWAVQQPDVSSFMCTCSPCNPYKENSMYCFSTLFFLTQSGNAVARCSLTSARPAKFWTSWAHPLSDLLAAWFDWQLLEHHTLLEAWRDSPDTQATTGATSIGNGL